MGAERRRGGPLQAQLQSPHLRNPNFGRPFSPHLLERKRMRVWRFCGCPCVGAGLGVGTASVLHGIFRDLDGNSRIPRSARGWDGRTRGFHSFGLKEWGWGGGREMHAKRGRGEPTATHTHHPAAPRGDNKLQLQKNFPAHRGTRRGAGRGRRGPKPARGSAGPGGPRGGDKGGFGGRGWAERNAGWGGK